MRSKGVAYLLWFLLGWAGVHRMYCGYWISGFIWLFTFGLFGFGWFIDLFLTSGMVDRANLMTSMTMGRGMTQNQSVIVNIQQPLAAQTQK